MGSLRKKLEVRSLNKGINPHGTGRVLSNEIGEHIFHVGENVELHAEGIVLTCEIIGEVNTHIMGEIVKTSPPDHIKQEFTVGKKVIFDEENIFDFYENE